MKSLIFIRHNKKLVSKCDSRCYLAKQPDCNCVCGGMNHGKGLDQAIINTQSYYKRWVRKFKKQRKLTKLVVKVPALRAGIQLDFFNNQCSQSAKDKTGI